VRQLGVILFQKSHATGGANGLFQGIHDKRPDLIVSVKRDKHRDLVLLGLAKSRGYPETNQNEPQSPTKPYSAGSRLRDPHWR
jgi:hypothetical protein